MDKTTPNTDWGSIQVEPIGPDDVPWARELDDVASEFSYERYTWVPDQTLRRHLPSAFTLSLIAIQSPVDGSRWFYPASSFDDFVRAAFAGGLAILIEAQGLTKEERSNYHLMWWLWQRVRKTGKHLKKEMLYKQDVEICEGEQNAAGQWSILPRWIGPGGDGEVSVGELYKTGRDEARRKGLTKPSQRKDGHHGLALAAKRFPLRCAQQEVPGLVRQALYLPELPVDRTRAVELKQIVFDLVVDTFEHRLKTKKPVKPFGAWFFNKKYVDEIAQRKRAKDAGLDRDLVSSLLQDLGWDSYAYVANALQAMMSVFIRLLADPLTAPEQRRFDRTFCKQPYLGDLPLVLVLERYTFLQSVLSDIGETDEIAELIPILHCLFRLYGEIAPVRRKIDTMVKGSMKGRKSDVASWREPGGQGRTHGQRISKSLVSKEMRKTWQNAVEIASLARCWFINGSKHWSYAIAPSGDMYRSDTRNRGHFRHGSTQVLRCS